MRIIILSIISSLFIISFSNAQNSSVYSRYGIGDVEYGYSPMMLSIGDLGITRLDPDHIIVSNPASWSALSKTRIELSLGYKGISISDNSDQYFTSETDFKGFTFGFPVSHEYGIGVVTGLVPFSRVSYKSVKNFTSSDADIPSYKVTYEGKGGISKLFLGSSVYLPFGFIAGATLDYYFGNLRYYSNIEFASNSDNINTDYENDHRTTGFGSTIGLISPNLAPKINIDLLSDLRLGLSVNYIAKLNTDTLLTATSSTQIDTVTISTDKKMKLPLRINGGISFVLNDSYHINLDYSYQPWSNFEFDGISNSYLQDASKFTAGFEYTPKKSRNMSLLEQMTWRGGVSFEKTQYQFNGNGINQFSVFGGFSFPMDIDNLIDFGIQYSIRGTSDNSLLKEEFVKLYFGISFGELWFLTYDK
ncbi:MAG: hypothetical protein WAV89_00165 [Ignavibacteriaceae bacterium]